MQWHLNSWQAKTLMQGVSYSCEEKLRAVLARLACLPPLVTPFEVEQLKQQLADAQHNRCFLLQGGDCAESFADCGQEKITNKLRILLQMSLILIHGLKKPIIRVGRIAGQYAKPRSNAQETIDGITLPSYRGDIVNAAQFNAAAREPDPERMILGYQYSATTLNYVRALVTSGFANLQHPEYWNLEFAARSPFAKRFVQIADNIRSALGFMHTIGINSDILKTVDFFTSHEALHLDYEAALTRAADNGKYYNLATHFPWVGMRTCSLEGAHLEYLRGIANPVAVKIGPEVSRDWLLQILEILNPDNEPGRLTLITRLGAAKVADLLPNLIETVQKAGIGVVWSCDPMHGNTVTVGSYKTRRFDDISAELEQAFKIHQQCRSALNGIHFELTGENVTECIGGSSAVTETDLKQAYKTLVDPRLNYEQALEIAMLCALSR